MIHTHMHTICDIRHTLMLDTDREFLLDPCTDTVHSTIVRRGMSTKSM